MRSRSDSQLRILHLIPSLGPGGAERQLSLLATAQAQAGLTCAVAFNNGGPNLELMVNQEVELFQLPQRGSYDVRRLFDIMSIVKTWKPDIIQTWLTQMEILGGIAAHVFRLPHIMTERSSRLNYPAGWKTSLRNLIGSHADAIVANAHVGAEYWSELAVKCPIVVIPNAITPVKSGVLSSKMPDQFRYVMFAGRLSIEKNLFNLISGVGRAFDDQSDCKALLFGEGPLHADVLNVIASTVNGDRIELRGFEPALHGWMARAAALIAVSDFEGHPNVVIEAAEANCPLILSDIPAHREIFTEKQAIFVDGHSPHQIATAIKKVLDRPEEARIRAVDAKKAVAGYSVMAMAKRYEEIYQSVTRNAATPINGTMP